MILKNKNMMHNYDNGLKQLKNNLLQQNVYIIRALK